MSNKRFVCEDCGKPFNEEKMIVVSTAYNDYHYLCVPCDRARYPGTDLKRYPPTVSGET